MSPTARLIADLRVPVAAPTPPDRFHSTLVRPGVRHLRFGRNCQDYAMSVVCPQGTILVVADGASRYPDPQQRADLPSANEAGAILVTEIAARAAAEGLEAGLSPDVIRDLVALQLHAGLRQLWATLGETAGLRSLCSTLLLGIVTNHYTRIYVSGDGSWGIFVPAGVDTDSLVGANLVVSERPGLVGIRSSAHYPKLQGVASTAARLSHAAVCRALPLALGIDVPVTAAWLATDGLADEPELQRRLHAGPARSREQLARVLTRPEESDDVAVAWVASRWPTPAEEAWFTPPDVLDAAGRKVAHG